MSAISGPERRVGLLQNLRGDRDFPDIVHDSGQVESLDSVLRQSHSPSDRLAELGDPPLMPGRIRVPFFERHGQDEKRAFHGGFEVGEALLEGALGPPPFDNSGQDIRGIEQEADLFLVPRVT